VLVWFISHGAWHLAVLSPFERKRGERWETREREVLVEISQW